MTVKMARHHNNISLPAGIPEQDFVMQTDSNNAAFDNTLLSQQQTMQKYDVNSNKERKCQESLIIQRDQDENMILSNISILNTHNDQTDKYQNTNKDVTFKVENMGF